MIYIIRATAGRAPPGEIKMRRYTPALVADAPGQLDYFCRGDPGEAKAAGWTVVPVHDGWYADDTGGGMAIWGQGQFWEVRDTPFTVREVAGPADSPSRSAAPDAADLNVRQAIFRG